jgi:hypothetical protein
VPRIDPDDFGDEEIARIFIAATMAEARAAETLLVSYEVRFAVVAEPLGRTIFGSPRNSAVFYVVADEADTCASLFLAAGMDEGVVKE